MERLHHVNNALQAEKDGRPPVMIKEHYLAIGEKQEARKYEPLRDILSHPEQMKPDTIKNLRTISEKGILF